MIEYDLPDICFDDAKPLEREAAAAAREQQYRDYRAIHRPFRSAFRGGMVAGERQRRIMGHVGQCNLRGLR